MRRVSYSLFFISYSLLLISCSVSKQISSRANNILINDTAINKGHIGISIYEPATGKYWYNYNADKYFIPASNTKLFTLYAGMKYLGDSLVGLRYKTANNITYIDFTGDPTFLHPDFRKQPILEFLSKQNTININKVYPGFYIYGKGWSWDDYTETFMAPRSVSPIYGNQVKIDWINADSLSIYPKYFYKYMDRSARFPGGFEVYKQPGNNDLLFIDGDKKSKSLPFEADSRTLISLLEDTLKNRSVNSSNTNSSFSEATIIHSQPSDSLFKSMMYNSDNFFAEQTLLMASNERLGYMSDENMIDTLLNTDLKEVPQKPRWVDGSGLSRYNLFTPRSFVYILDKMKAEFGLDRLKNILPSGGAGSLKNYFLHDNLFIYAKTGTLSNNCALSGFLITAKGKLLIFSVLVNNYQTGATPIRRAVEHFLHGIREKY